MNAVRYWLLASSLITNSYQMIYVRTCDSFEAFYAVNSDERILKSTYLIGNDVRNLIDLHLTNGVLMEMCCMIDDASEFSWWFNPNSPDCT